jgi:hypothetical protein
VKSTNGGAINIYEKNGSGKQFDVMRPGGYRTEAMFLTVEGSLCPTSVKTTNKREH